VTAPEQVSVRVRFERFPATVKGAFIIRGEDRDPHQVVLRESRVVAVDGRTARPLSMGLATLDVAPHHDVFVPFELGVTDLDPGWYGFVCDLDVDGVAVSSPGDKRFVVAWPRGTVRRGQVGIGKELRLGTATTVRIEQLECGGDSIKLHLSVMPPGRPTVKLSADGNRLEILRVEADEASGRVRVTAYPLLRSHNSLTIGLKGRGRGVCASVDIPLL
jgi:hypothetical protein